MVQLVTETQTVDLAKRFVKDLSEAMWRWIRVAGPASAAIVGVVAIAAFWWDKV